MPRSTTSIRLEDELRQQLAAQAGVEATTVTDLIERFVREGLACAAHPGIVFKLEVLVAAQRWRAGRTCGRSSPRYVTPAARRPSGLPRLPTSSGCIRGRWRLHWRMPPPTARRSRRASKPTNARWPWPRHSPSSATVCSLLEIPDRLHAAAQHGRAAGCCRT